VAFIFGKKKEGDDKALGNGQASAPKFEADPAKADKFFGHARTVQESENYEYAMQLWLNGMRQNPLAMPALESFFVCAAKFLAGGKSSPSKDLVKSLTDGSEISKYLLGLLEWGMKPDDAGRALKAMEGAAALGIKEPTLWIGERAAGWAAGEKNPKRGKEYLVKISQLFTKVGANDKAVTAAEAASKLDPSDSELAATVRSLAATATMTRGGYDKTGQEGGFRSNIRDLQKQQRLDDADRIVKTEETKDRIVLAAEEEYAKRPGDLPTIEVLGKALLDRNKPGDETRAFKIFASAYESTKQFRFREMAGDIRLRRQARKVRGLREMVEKSNDSEREMAQRMLETEQQEYLKMEAEEFRLRVENYPTDLSRKYELAKRVFMLGGHDEAIGLLQETQHDAKLRTNSLNMLGQSFLKIGYHDEAVQTFRSALEARDIAPDLSLELRYNLMSALVTSGEAGKSADALREAEKLASSIAMQQFSYRDIRQKREDIKKLLAAVTAGG
jgi:tetratricopeptide (TPR) repeat protein